MNPVKQIIQFVPFSDMPELPQVSHIEHLLELRIDDNDREIHNAQAERTHKQRNSAPLRYTAKESVERRRAATCCEMCKKPLIKLKDKHGDHDHQTGHWRGVLCCRCNLRLGWYETLKNDVDFLQSVQVYLEKVRELTQNGHPMCNGAHDFPKGMFQVLCRNCNEGRALNGGICPHKGETCP